MLQIKQRIKVPMRVIRKIDDFVPKLFRWVLFHGLKVPLLLSWRRLAVGKHLSQLQHVLHHQKRRLVDFLQIMVLDRRAH